MDTIFKFLFDFLGQFFGSIWGAIVGVAKGIVGMFNLTEYVKIIEAYTTTLGGLAWVVAIIAIILLAAVLGVIVFFIVMSVKKFVRFKKKVKDTNDLVNEVNALNKEVMRMNLEKDKILSMKVSQIGLNPNEISELTGEEMEALNKGEEEAKSGRFNKLAAIDVEWADYQPPEYDWEITLPEFCDRFRNFACSRLRLFYDIKILRCFIAAFASNRLLILQGISGTGKTSLPYAFGKYVQNPAIIASVQPSWRDRTELFGYFNEFTKRFNETEVLKKMYEARFMEDVSVIILDEMNIARVEYYFAELLSILEMPSRDEWVVSLVPTVWPTDPELFFDGKFKLPPNMWYVGTINNDDSTFAVTDKVYDRAIPIDINTKGKYFEAPLTDPIYLNYKHLEALFDEAKAKYPVSEDALKKFAELDDYVIEHFRIAFGNRILKQLKDFVPVYVGCGGKEIDGIDFILAHKILRKFESLNISYIRNEIGGLITYLNKNFGKNNMKDSKEYLERLQKLV